MKALRLPSVVNLLGVFLLARSKLGQAAGEAGRPSLEAERMAPALTGGVGLRQQRPERELRPHAHSCLRSEALTLLRDSGFSWDAFPS